MKINIDKLNNKTILIKKDGGVCIENSAQQLSYYIKKILKVSLSVSVSGGRELFCIGTADNFPDDDLLDKSITAKLFDDGFAIYSADNVIVITALTPRGVLYGVYDYFERFYGVRYLTKSFEYVPASDYFVMPDRAVVSNPDFTMRGYFVGDTYMDRTYMKNVDFDFVSKTKAKDVFLEIPEKYGGANKVYGRNVVHNFHFYAPFEVYGNEHPEWYRFMYINEAIYPTIDITNGIDDNGELDTTMEMSVAKAVINEIVKDAINHPDKDIINFTEEDGGIYYDSPRVRTQIAKYKHSGILVRFVNVVVREVNKYLKANYNRTIKIVTFAYSYTKEPPVEFKNGKYVPLDKTCVCDENVIIQLALFGKATVGYFDKDQDDSIKEIINGWAAVGNDFWFWMYDINFHKYNYYFDSFDFIGDNVRGFKKTGMSYLCINGPYEDSGNWQCNMRSYVYRKMMWDSTLDENELLNEYIRLYYGIAEPYIKEFMDLFHKNKLKCMEDKSYDIKSWGPMELAVNNPKEMLLKSLNLLEQAEKLIEKTYSGREKEIYLEHIWGVKVTPLIMLYDMYFDHNPYGSKEEYYKLKKEFFDTCRKSKVDYAGERWTIDQYEEECVGFDRERIAKAEEFKKNNPKN